MEQNACRVAKDVAERINYEPGPAGDFIQSHLSPQKDEQFFFNTEHLRQFVSSAESKQKNVPGCAYFKKISVFLQSHVLSRNKWHPLRVLYQISSFHSRSETSAQTYAR